MNKSSKGFKSDENRLSYIIGICHLADFIFGVH